MCFFMGPQISLIWTSGDVSSGFPNQSGQPYSHLPEKYAIYIPETHLWCYTCQSLGSQNGSQAFQQRQDAGFNQETSCIACRRAYHQATETSLCEGIDISCFCHIVTLKLCSTKAKVNVKANIFFFIFAVYDLNFSTCSLIFSGFAWCKRAFRVKNQNQASLCIAHQCGKKHLYQNEHVLKGCSFFHETLTQFFVVRPILSDLAIMYSLGLRNLKQNVTPSRNRNRASD